LTSLLPMHRAVAQVPPLIRFQGQAVDSQGVPLEGPYTLTFRLYDTVTAGTKLWEETQTNVALSKGHFSVLLGQVASLASMNWSQPRWLAIQVGTQPELSPRQQFTSVPLALRAEMAEQVVDTSVRVTHSANLSIAHDTTTVHPFDSEFFDTGAFHAPATPGRLTAPAAGKYFRYCTSDWAVRGTGTRNVILRLNGATFLATATAPGLSAANLTGQSMTASTHAALSAGDYVECVVRQDSGAALNSSDQSDAGPVFGMVKLP
jgi:hypothetical protein